MITIKDVAEKAQVSIATASRALSQKGYVSDEAYEKVINAADELGYVANLSAQQLKNSSSRTIGFIISDISNEYYFSILSNIQKMLMEHGMNLIIAFSSENPTDEQNSFRSLIASRVSAILFTPTSKDNIEIINTARKNGIRVIQLFREVYSDLDAIVNDDESGCMQAAQELINSGCKKLLLIDVEYEYLDFDKVKPNRSNGFLKAIKEHPDVQYEIMHFPLVNYNTSILFKKIQSFNPDGIITATNVAGLCVLKYLKANNLKTKLVTFDDNNWLDYCSVSAIRQNTEILTECIYDFIQCKKTPANKQSIPQKLILRNI